MVYFRAAADLSYMRCILDVVEIFVDLLISLYKMDFHWESHVSWILSETVGHVFDII